MDPGLVSFTHYRLLFLGNQLIVAGGGQPNELKGVCQFFFRRDARRYMVMMLKHENKGYAVP